MNLEKRIFGFIEDANYAEAVEAYQKEKSGPITANLSLQLARAYHCLGRFEEALGLLQPIQNYSSTADAYEGIILQLKERFLLEKDTIKSVRKLEGLSSNRQLQQHHIKVIADLKAIVDAEVPNKSLYELIAEAKEFSQLWEQQTDNPQLNSLNWEGFPGFLISKPWFNQWRSYVRMSERELDRSCPGVISQFQILDHCFYHLQDQLPQKMYTNQYLFDTEQIMVLPRKCWEFLAQRYGGVFIERYGTINTSNIVQTEVQLQKVQVEIKGQTHKHFVQLSRLSFWKDLSDKLVRILGRGRLWKVVAGKMLEIEPDKLLEDDDFSTLSLVFQRNSTFKAEVVKAPVCENCGKAGKLKMCKDCKSARYCNMECLNEDRKRHEKTCRSLSRQHIEMSSLSLKFNLSQSEVIRGKKGVVGLRNLGNTCYLNSALQCLSNTQQLTNFFISSDLVKELNLTNVLGSGGEIACYYSKLVRELWSCNDSAISSWQLRRQICKKFPQFSGYSQHDSMEFLGTLLDVLHEDTNLVKVKPITSEDDKSLPDQQASKLAFQTYRLRNKSFICDRFTSQYKTTMVCSKCNKKITTFQHFTIVPLPIPQPIEIQLNLVRTRHSNQKLTLLLYPQDKIRSIAESLSKKYGILCEDIRFFRLGADYTVMEELCFEDSIQRLIYMGQGEMNTCYEIPHVNHKTTTTYQVQFYQSQKSVGKLCYPRFVALPNNTTQQEIRQSIRGVLQIYSLYDKIKDSSFQWDIKDKCINVYVKSTIFKRQSYYYSNKRVEVEGDSRSHTLKNCFELFSKEETLDQQNTWYCKTCKQHNRARRRIQIYYTNRILIVSLKRYSRGKKIRSMIQYPITGLDTSEMGVLNGGIYDLYAVINHYGSMTNGHYTAYCKNYVNNVWYQFNDSKVAELNLRDIITDHAYILFYRLRD